MESTVAGHQMLLSEAAASDLVSAALALARAFSQGATMWCLAPQWPEHGRHLAVEFVHPVIMGKRALPSVSVEDPDPVSALRAVVRPGDIVLAVATASSAPVAAALRRAPAWGAGTVWLGSGPRPPAGAAEHVLWVDDPEGFAPADGRLVMRYHVLWEMTHVCLEHPGLLTARAGAPADCTDEVCITCSDEGILAEVVSIGESRQAAGATGIGAVGRLGDVVVRTAAGSQTVDATLVGSVVPGDLVLIHAGTALVLVEAAP